MKDLGPVQEQFRLQVVCMISEVYIDDRRYEQIKGLLQNEAVHSRRHSFYHAKLLLLFSVSSHTYSGVPQSTVFRKCTCG